MAKPSVFRDFVAALKAQWRAELPSVRPLDRAFGPILPRASSFYAGVARPRELHVFLGFQHSTKSWQVGWFTVNIVLSRDEAPHDVATVHVMPEDPASPAEGSHRIGPFLGGKDKWWHLKDRESYEAWPFLTELNDLVTPVEPAGHWRPTSFDDADTVLGEAVADVTRDMQAVLRKLGVDGHS